MNLYELSVTITSSLSVFGGYFMYETITILQNPITKDLNITEDAYGILFTVSSGASLILSIPTILLMMRLGFLSLLLFNILFMISALLLSLVLSISSNIRYTLLLSIMILFGYSYDSMGISQGFLLVEEIPSNKLTVPLALSTTIIRLGSILSFLTTIPVINMFGGDYRYAFYYSTIICGISLGINMIYTIITRLPIRSDVMLIYTKLPTKLLVLLLVYAFGYLPYYIYRTYANYIISVNHNISLEVSTWYLMGVEIISLFLTPLIGWKFKDQHVWYPYILAISIILGILGYITALFITDILLSVLLWGLYISGVSSMIWPLISTSLPVNRQVVTFTLVSIVNNVFNMVFYIIGGLVVSHDIDGSLTGLTILIGGLTGVGLMMNGLYIILSRESMMNCC